MYKENDQWITTTLNGEIPAKDFYEQIGYPKSTVTPIMRSPDQIEEGDLYSKVVKEAKTPQQLISQIEGDGALFFRYDSEGMELGSKTEAMETWFEVDNEAEEELSVIDNLLRDNLEGTGDIDYGFAMNTSNYLSMEKLREGLGAPVIIEPDLQGVNSIFYKLFSEIEIRQYNPKAIQISESFVEDIEGRDTFVSFVEGRIRQQIYEEGVDQDEVTYRHRIRDTVEDFTIQNEDWEIVDYPVDTGAIEALEHGLENKGIESTRLMFSPGQQPMDTDPVIFDFEEL